MTSLIQRLRNYRKKNHQPEEVEDIECTPEKQTIPKPPILRPPPVNMKFPPKKRFDLTLGETEVGLAAEALLLLQDDARVYGSDDLMRREKLFIDELREEIESQGEIVFNTPPRPRSPIDPEVMMTIQKCLNDDDYYFFNR